MHPVGLCCRGGDNCYLSPSAEHSQRCVSLRRTYSVTVKQEDLHLRSTTPGAVSDRDHLADVAGDSLNDVHDGCLIDRSTEIDSATSLLANAHGSRSFKHYQMTRKLSQM